MDLHLFLTNFQDHLAPKLDTYEQTVYLYIFRHSRLLGIDEVTIGFRSARMRMASGVGQDGTPMADSSVRKKLRSLEAKKAIAILGSEHGGLRIRLHLPFEIPGLIPETSGSQAEDIETMDFFEVDENRRRILERENHRCFYTLVKLDEKKLRNRSRGISSRGRQRLSKRRRSIPRRQQSKGGIERRGLSTTTLSRGLLVVDRIGGSITPAPSTS